MATPLAIVFMIVLYGAAIAMFVNEVRYRRRISAVGILIFIAVSYLLYYTIDINQQLLELTNQLVKYKPAAVIQGK